MKNVITVIQRRFVIPPGIPQTSASPRDAAWPPAILASQRPDAAASDKGEPLAARAMHRASGRPSEFAEHDLSRYHSADVCVLP